MYRTKTLTENAIIGCFWAFNPLMVTPFMHPASPSPLTITSVQIRHTAGNFGPIPSKIRKTVHFAAYFRTQKCHFFAYTEYRVAGREGDSCDCYAILSQPKREAAGGTVGILMIPGDRNPPTIGRT